jgi:hypothetical protein
VKAMAVQWKLAVTNAKPKRTNTVSYSITNLKQAEVDRISDFLLHVLKKK